MFDHIKINFLTLFVLPLWLYYPLAANEGNHGGAGAGERSIITYSVKNNSWLSLKGSTNVNAFECFSSNEFSNGYIFADAIVNEKRVDFTEANIEVNVSSFDCKNPLITRDMHKALGACQGSGIGIQLLSAETFETNWNDDKGNLLANILITINGISTKEKLNIEWQRQGFEYSFKGTADLSMIDFNIDPPSPAIGLGLVRVNDKITVNFNYNVQSGEISRLD
jgi:hypothetical protein